MATTKTVGIQISSSQFMQVRHSIVARSITVAVLGGGKERRIRRAPPTSAVSTTTAIATTAVLVLVTVASPLLSVPAKVQKMYLVIRRLYAAVVGFCKEVLNECC